MAPAHAAAPTLADLFEAQAARTPTAPALIQGAEAVTFAELDARANRIAHRLRARGVAAETPVGILLPRSIDLTAAVLGTLKAGGAWLPLDISGAPARGGWMLADAGAPVLITRSGVPAPEGWRGEVMRLDAEAPALAAADGARPPPRATRPESLAYVIYTSGSTGRPKAVGGLHGATINRLTWGAAAEPFAPDEVCCQKTSPAFVDSVCEIFAPLLAGIPTVVVSDAAARDPRALVDVLAAHGVTRIVVVPSLLRALLDDPALGDRLPRLQRWVCSGEALPAELCARFFAALPGRRLLNLYGSSEVAADVTAHAVDPADLPTVPIGRPLPGTRVYVLGDAGRLAGDGEEGEIHVGGEQLARGYLGRPALTAERFLPDPFAGVPGARMYRMGDRGRWRPVAGAERALEDAGEPQAGTRTVGGGEVLAEEAAAGGAPGVLECLGRTDGQVKIRGHRVELAEVEAALAAQPGVREAAVALRGPPGDERLEAYVVPAHDPGDTHGRAPAIDRPAGQPRRDAPTAGRCAPDRGLHPRDGSIAAGHATAGTDAAIPAEGIAMAGELRRRLLAWLPEYMVPATYVTLAALPRTPSGKLDRLRLPSGDGARAATGEAYLPPLGATEEALAAIWAELLGMERVGAADTFVGLGGHSLLATRMAFRVHAALAVDLPAEVLLEPWPLRRLARWIDDNRAESGDAPASPAIPRAPRDRPLPITILQEFYWLREQLEPGRPGGPVPYALRLRGALDVPALARALAECVRRHEALRTTFASHGGAPVQIIAQPAGDAEESPEAVLRSPGARSESRGSIPIPLPCIDLARLEAGAREREVRRLRGDEAGRPFDLERGPLLRVRLLRLAAREWVLLATLHHIICDGWSVDVLVRELGALYDAIARGRSPDLPAPPIQPADYAAWQRSPAGLAAMERHAAYWRAHLAGARPLDMAGEGPGPARIGPRRAHPFVVSGDALAAIRRLARDEGASLVMVMLAGFAALLARYSGTADVTVEVVLAGRSHPELAEVIGFFAQMALVRTDLSGDPTFREAVGRVLTALLGAREHQELPVFERLGAATEIAGYAPLRRVRFGLQQTESRPPALGDVAVEPLDAGPDAGPSYSEDLVLQDAGGHLRGWFVYRLEMFPDDVIAQAVRDYVELLARASADPALRLSALAPAPAAEPDFALEFA